MELYDEGGQEEADLFGTRYYHGLMARGWRTR